MNHLLFGPRWMRLVNFWSVTIVSGLTAVVTAVIAVIVGISNLVAIVEGTGTRDRFLTFVFFLSLAGIAGALCKDFGQDAIAIYRGSLDGSSAKKGWTIQACCAYGTVACLVFLSSAPGVPLWVSLLIVVLPPAVLVAVRYPKLNQERQARKAAARPKKTVRNQRVARRSTRAQRRSGARP